MNDPNSAAKDTKLTFDLLVKAVGEVNADLRQAETAAISVFFAAVTVSGAGAAIFVKNFDDLAHHWQPVLLVACYAFSAAALIINSLNMRLKTAKERLEWIDKLAHDKNQRYVLELFSATSLTSFRVAKSQIRVLIPDIKVALFISRMLMYAIPLVLAASAIWPHLQQWR